MEAAILIFMFLSFSIVEDRRAAWALELCFVEEFVDKGICYHSFKVFLALGALILS
jgi:hypothetical protein